MELLGLRVTNYKDIHTKWVVLHDANKPLNLLGEVVGLIIDEFYEEMKNLFDKEYHQCWVVELCDAQIAYACMDAYACLAVWRRIYLIEQGRLEAKER